MENRTSLSTAATTLHFSATRDILAACCLSVMDLSIKTQSSGGAKRSNSNHQLLLIIFFPVDVFGYSYNYC